MEVKNKTVLYLTADSLWSASLRLYAETFQFTFGFAVLAGLVATVSTLIQAHLLIYFNTNLFIFRQHDFLWSFMLTRLTASFIILYLYGIVLRYLNDLCTARESRASLASLSYTLLKILPYIILAVLVYTFFVFFGMVFFILPGIFIAFLLMPVFVDVIGGKRNLYRLFQSHFIKNVKHWRLILLYIGIPAITFLLCAILGAHLLTDMMRLFSENISTTTLLGIKLSFGFVLGVFFIPWFLGMLVLFHHYFCNEAL